MYENPLIEFFPLDERIKEIRHIQITALDAIWNAIQNNETKITLCASTGSGKSKIGETVMRYFAAQGKKSIYTSPLNSLVDQIETTKHQDSKITTIKGRRYYDCFAKGNGIRCDSGYCTRGICYVTRNASKEHRIKRDCKLCRLQDCACHHCIYKALFRKYRNSQAGNTNSSLWLMGIVPEGCNILVIDEVDSLESFVRMQYTVAVDRHLSTDFGTAIEELKEYREGLQMELNELKTVFE